METYQKIKNDLLWAFAVAAALALFLDASEYGRDNTDGKTRSNMHLHTDALTGCQYLSVFGGGITPRLDSSGKQICSHHER